MNPIVPIPKCDVAIRVATMADLPSLDALQKRHNRALGYFPTKQFEGYIAMGGVLVAEDGNAGVRVGVGVRVRPEEEPAPDLTHTLNPTLTRPLLGYVISRDRYLKRDELGVIYQLCVNPGAQRKLVGATLVKEVFARSAYECRLYCCWCAQDLEANHFWESLGFVPIAFRAGSSGKRRVHIFWQKRIVEGDAETRWWYPLQTNSGAIRQDRIVFPIPPGTHWTEVKAVAIPNGSADMKVLSAESKTESKAKPRGKRTQNSELSTQNSVGLLSGFRFASDEKPKPARAAKAKTPKAPPVKIDPKFFAAARELRDRWMERVNDDPSASRLHGKYDVARMLPP